MTGFARAAGQFGDTGWTWEIKSVNARSLDMRFRVPPGLDHLEVQARSALGAEIKRGNVTIQLNLSRPAGPPALAVNEAFLDQLIVLAARYKGRVADEAPRFDSLLAVRGVVEAVEQPAEAAEEAERRDAGLLAGFRDCVKRLRAAREEEGARLAATLDGILREIADQVHAAGSCASAQPEAIATKLKEQLSVLLGATPQLTADRLVQEAALLATKADVREELDRLDAHIKAARRMLGEGGAIGRQFDFLCQEFNREANTLCSKAADMELTNIGLKLKSAIEGLREQVQNIE